MSQYRWLRPLKCLETMEYFPAILETDFANRSRKLFEAVARGDIRAKLNDVTIPPAHIEVYLSLYARATPDQELHTLPPDLAINYDDLCTVFDRPNVDDRKRGRPRKDGSSHLRERRLAAEMHRMLINPSPQATSAADAARQLVKTGRFPGSGTDENRAKRLERIFREYYSS